MKQCPKCGNINSDDAKFCARCGNIIENIPFQNQNSGTFPPKPQNINFSQKKPGVLERLLGKSKNQQEIERLNQVIIELNNKLQFEESKLQSLKNENQSLSNRLKELGADNYFQAQEKIKHLQDKMQQCEVSYNEQITENNQIIYRLRSEISELSERSDKLSKQTNTQTKKLQRLKSLYQSVEHAINNFFYSDVDYSNCRLAENDYNEYELICPTITLKLHCMDIRDLRKAYRDNEKQITKLLEQYSARYTTKSNKSIYNLMVIALRAELQNIIYNLKYEKLDSSIEAIKDISAKYLKIAGEGNQSIAGTLTKFIGELEYLFINAVKIEYNYYVKKEQAKQEQLAIREQMRQEAEERKALEQEKKKIEDEESKYNNEIEKLRIQIQVSAEQEKEALNAKILELQTKLADVTIKKDSITQLQNGKAGNVYIISNLGSFGENVFKVGMTRRINPQDRVNELGDASVPFKFDVHSFIFSEDAVGLESKLHSILNDKRVNKVNMRKEFFYTSVDELEKIVNEIEPTAEFNKTMLADEFRQSQSSDENYTSDYISDEDDE